MLNFVALGYLNTQYGDRGSLAQERQLKAFRISFSGQLPIPLSLESMQRRG
jgi:hypothetical protein